MPTLIHALALATLIVPTDRCPQCRCGSFLTTRQERADRLCTSCADAPAVFDVHPGSIAAWAIAKVRAEEEMLTVLPCGCYSDACHCGQYPTAEEMSAMQTEADALLPDREPITDAEATLAEELRNFFGGPND
jgi:hypothetical protein